MKCPECGYLSFDNLENCKRCGVLLTGDTAGKSASRAGPGTVAWAEPGDPHPGGQGTTAPEPGGMTTGNRTLSVAPSPRVRRRGPRRGRAAAVPESEHPAASDERPANPRFAGDGGTPGPGSGRAGDVADDEGALLVDGEVDLGGPRFPAGGAGASEPSSPSFFLGPAGIGGDPLLDSRADSRDFVLEGWGAGAGTAVIPIIEREEEVPDSFWAPESAGLGRRTVALLVDQALLAAVLALFFLAAAVALRLSGFDTEHLFAAAGLRAVLLPFAVLAALLSLVYHVSFHGGTGRTPGKTLAGVEVRTEEGEVPTRGRAAARWFAAALGLACAGVGIAWALFEPRRRGWADLLTKTTLAERRDEEGGGPRRR